MSSLAESFDTLAAGRAYRADVATKTDFEKLAITIKTELYRALWIQGGVLVAIITAALAIISTIAA